MLCHYAGVRCNLMLMIVEKLMLIRKEIYVGVFYVCMVGH